MARSTVKAGMARGLLLAAALCATPAIAASRQPASQDELFAGVRSCAASISATGVDEAKLVADGWSRGAITEGGRPVAPDLIFYGKGNLMLMSARVAAAGKPICSIVARIASVGDYASLRTAMTAAYGAPVKDDARAGQIYIAPDHRIIALASTGSNKEPSVRIAVGPVFQETK